MLFRSCILFLLLSIGLNVYYIGFKKCDECICPKCNLKSVKQDTEKSISRVDVKGEVNNPGVIELESGSIVDDAIKKAGGVTENADLKNTNLSKKIEDEMVIYIYSKDEVKESNQTINYNEKTNSVINSNSSLININTASVEELKTLNGIGESKAQRIIEYRNNTPFKSIEDIKNVDGIGDKAFEKIKDKITI